MEAIYNSLANIAIELLKERKNNNNEKNQIFIGIAGGPGSGKTTTAAQVCKLLNRKHIKSIVLPMDGYHFYKKELDLMENPEEAHQFRGAPFTFNSKRFIKDMVNAKSTGTGSFPDFDHAAGDPNEGQIKLDTSVEVVFVEGNYVLLKQDPWCELSNNIFDLCWFIKCPEEEAQKRVVLRHMKAWNFTEELALARWLDNDLKNYRFINNNSISKMDKMIESVSHV